MRRNTEKVPSICAKATVKSSTSTTHRPTTGIVSTDAAPFMVRTVADGLPGTRVSGRKNQVLMRLRADSPAANRPMARLPPHAPSTPPSAGPITKPRPNAAPMMPMPRARSWGLVMSATTACAVDTLPPDTPSMTRERNSSGSVSAKANST
ncbi:hypothetical protein COSO111634_37680 [Corallococcus soli]